MPRVSGLAEIRGVPLSGGNVWRAIEGADAVIRGILIHGGPVAPKLLTREHLRLVGGGAVVVDVSIVQGGILETSKPTTHAEPIFVEEGVVHYCVANMPDAVPYIMQLAELGTERAIATSPELGKGLMTREGTLVNPSVQVT